MPRGGKRPGAGAPKGNLNAARDAYFIANAARINRYIGTHPNRRLFAQELLRVGIFRMSPLPALNVRVRLYAAYVYRHMIEFPHQSNSIKGAPRCHHCAPSDPAP